MFELKIRLGVIFDYILKVRFLISHHIYIVDTVFKGIIVDFGRSKSAEFFEYAVLVIQGNVLQLMAFVN